MAWPGTILFTRERTSHLEELQEKEKEGKEEKEEKEEKEVPEQEDQEENSVGVVSCKSPSFLGNIFSSLRLSSPSQAQPLQLGLSEPQLEPGLEPGEKKVVVEPVSFFPADSLPVVSLLPTLTEEITISLTQSHNSNAGWFRRNYTSIDTVQKIYGTHPRYGQRRPGAGGGMSRPRR